MIGGRPSLGTSDCWSFSWPTTSYTLSLSPPSSPRPRHYSFLLCTPFVPCSLSSFCTLHAWLLCRACWFLLALQPILCFPFSRPVQIASCQHLHCNPSYPYPSSYLVHICVHFPFTMHLNPENGGRTALRNSCIQLPHYTAQQLRRLHIISSPLWKPHMPQANSCSTGQEISCLL